MVIGLLLLIDAKICLFGVWKSQFQEDANFKKTPISDYQSSFGLIIIWRLLNKLGKDYRKEENISIIKVFYFTVFKRYKLLF